MRLKMRQCLLALILLASTLHAQGLNNVSQYTLDNGLTVILNPDHTKAEVFGYVVCKAGGKDDPADATGMAHYMEHMLFKGTEDLGTTDWAKEKPHIDSIFVLYDELKATSNDTLRTAIQQKINEQSIEANKYAIPNELSTIIKRTGGTGMNANTSPDRTVFFNTFPPNQIEAWLEIYGHRFQKAVFRSFQSELEVVYEEKNMYSDMFIMNIIERLQHDFFKKHPYGQQTLIGTVEDLKNPSLTKMKEFYETWYVPNNMALVLSGDFDPELVKPLIAKTFGPWKRKETPERKTWQEEPFNGRELSEVNMSPVKMELLAYRTVPVGHPDQIVLQVCNGLLSNESQSGLMDKLVLDKELMALQVFPYPYYDYGMNIFFCVPKLVGQSLEEAEQLILGKLAMLKAGDFEDWRIDAIKKEMYRQHMEKIESNEGRGIMIGETFAQGRDINTLNTFPQRINKITKEDVLRVANKYYGDNYLALFSKMGSYKGKKIDKPGYKPVISNTSAESKFAQGLRNIKPLDYEVKYLDFDKEVSTEIMGENTKLFCVKNRQNDIFSLTLKFNQGEHLEPLLGEAMHAMGDAYTKEFSKGELKDEFAKLGASYHFSSDKSYSYISIYGLDENFENTMILLAGLLDDAQLDQKDVDFIVKEVETGRKMEREDIGDVASAAFQWVKYGDKSDFIDRLTLKETKALQAEELVNKFKQATSYAAEAHYAGSIAPSTVSQILSKTLHLDQKHIAGTGVYTTPLQEYKQDVVYFVNKKKASQAKLYFFANETPFKTEDIPTREAFNMYFGGGFSGLVLQEIREYRSLAYGAGAGFSSPDIEGAPSFFYGFIGTQADKTEEALEVFNSLVDSMPHKTERIEMIRPYLEQSAFTKHPDFRGLSEYMTELALKGINDDPAKRFNEAYKNLEFQDIVSFYENKLQGKPMVTLVVGDKKKIDLKMLSKYGKVIEIKEKALYSK